jgi:hypothetical protein
LGQFGPVDRSIEAKSAWGVWGIPHGEFRPMRFSLITFAIFICFRSDFHSRCAQYARNFPNDQIIKNMLGSKNNFFVQKSEKLLYD